MAIAAVIHRGIRSGLASVAWLILPLAAHAGTDEILRQTRDVAAAMPPKLMAELQREIAAGGMVAAIAACNDKAPKMAQAMSAKTGWAIRRVSLKNRNPKAVPDAWERAVLIEFDRDVAAGADPATLEKFEIVEMGNQRVFRYMKALPTQPLCLSCHGSATEIMPQVKAKLHELYPDDKATGYRVGEVRGAITIKRPLMSQDL